MSTPSRSKYANSTKKAFYFPDTNEKICAKCGVKSPIENFFKHKQTQDGYHSWCKTCCKEGNQKSIKKKYSTFEGRIPTFLNSCKRSSIKRKQEFSLTKEDFMRMWKEQCGHCAYSFIKMQLEPNTPYSVSVERIDSSIGYTKENTVLVCNAVNRMKTDLNPELFFEFCSAVAKHLGDERGILKVSFVK